MILVCCRAQKTGQEHKKKKSNHFDLERTLTAQLFKFSFKKKSIDTKLNGTYYSDYYICTLFSYSKLGAVGADSLFCVLISIMDE